MSPPPTPALGSGPSLGLERQDLQVHWDPRPKPSDPLDGIAQDSPSPL